MSSQQNYFTPLIKLFESNANDSDARAMEKYMKNRFSFYGIKSPIRKELQKHFFAEYGKPAIENINLEIKSVWNSCNRELNYTIVDILKHKSYLKHENSIQLAEWLLVNQSWWDTVDAIATHCVGQYLQNYPELKEEYNAKWILSDNMWLNRTAIIFQLKYKEQTNFELLKNNIRHFAGEKEFFIKKAIGWALREYSKTNPSAIIKFLDENDLQQLSIREASKYL